ncbi:BTB/POZ domain-containing protein At3g44820-like isoform X2 [Primulina huaijiensis]|uniref:BTB/POZ domain-containing protein At3g44820-like isoform X2 n=1 Tax=Primulina huaijiensis TaxID=1492673 RepID=UPI003CC719B3
MAAHAGKYSGLYCRGNDWYCNASLPSDITLVMDGVNFHLHKFPLISRCGKLAKFIEQSPSTSDKTLEITLEEFPGGVCTFLDAVRFCYGGRIEFTPRNIVSLYCAADYLDMTDDYGEDNLLSTSEIFFHKQVLKSWKNCIVALRSCEPVFQRLDKLDIIIRCLDALSVMVCTDPSLFGWPMMMYGSLQSPGGSILWNGINTGAKIHSFESDWWFEDVSFLGVELFERLIQRMEAKGIKPENLVRAIMYYCKKYLPGLDRWKGGQVGISRTVASFTMTPAVVDQLFLLERVVNLLPQKKDRETSSVTGRWKKVAKLVDNYIAEVASDVNLKPKKVRSLAEALPESSRSLHDGLYRALDIYFQTHPWLSEKEREHLCSIIDFQKLSIDACAHASHNERLPLRVTFQVLYFEQIQLKTALARYRHVLDVQTAPAASLIEMSGQIVQRDGWVTLVRENHGLKTDMERMKPRVEKLEQEFGKIKEEMKRVVKPHSYRSSPSIIARRIGCNLLVRHSNAQSDILESMTPTPRASVEQAQPSTPYSRNCRSFSLL